MKITVIGGKGHIGTYLVPRLVELGHELTCVSRGRREPYLPHAAWAQVRQVVLDREGLEAEGDFGRRIAALAPEAVIDLICFGPESALQLAGALEGRIQHFLACGTIWVHGPSVEVPTTEEAPRAPFGEYGVRKAAMEAALLDFARRRGFPATVLHPGHIVGRGWVPLNPAGNFNPAVFTAIARGQTLTLPNLGLETVHHVHADDVAQGFVRALGARQASAGESFHIVSPAALTLRGFAERMFAWFGRRPALAYLPWEEWRKTVSEEDAKETLEHISHSPCCSIRKAQRVLCYQPRYCSLEAVTESVQWLQDNKVIRQ
jgi:nucleoside-diphosphate-sugar epimerase